MDYTTLIMFIYNIMNSLQEYFMGYQINISLFEILKIRFWNCLICFNPQIDISGINYLFIVGNNCFFLINGLYHFYLTASYFSHSAGLTGTNTFRHLPAVGGHGKVKKLCEAFRCQLEGLFPPGWDRKRRLTRNKPICEFRQQVSGCGEASS